MRRLALLLVAAIAITTHADAKGKAKKKKPASPPVAFYLADWGTMKGKTRDEAVERCKSSRAQQVKKNPSLEGYDMKPREKTVIAVRGPYDRKGQKDTWADPSVYVYRGSDGAWYDADGESPCFVQGTRISTHDGERPIEALREGDVV